jgi:hypothetical protein
MASARVGLTHYILDTPQNSQKLPSIGNTTHATIFALKNGIIELLPIINVTTHDQTLKCVANGTVPP